MKTENGKTISAKYAGVLLTGWGDGCGCGTGDEVVRPLVNGLFYFSDTVSYEVTSKTGRVSTKNQKVVLGGEVRAE